jgi:hypothetical protein
MGENIDGRCAARGWAAVDAAFPAAWRHHRALRAAPVPGGEPRRFDVDWPIACKDVEPCYDKIDAGTRDVLAM